MSMYIRFRKRKTTWAKGDAKAIFEDDFCDNGNIDLNVSIYHIKNSSYIPQIAAEHQANAGLDVASSYAMDITGGLALSKRPPVQKTDHRYFDLLDRAHYEIPFQSEQEVRIFVNSLLRCSPITHTQADLKKYVQAAYATPQGKKEWDNFFNTALKGKGWRRDCKL